MGILVIAQRHQGNRHGIIRRLISPEDLGQRLKPFIFLDYINTNAQERFGFGFHPHSGIATLTYQQGADVEYEDTAGQKGVVEALQYCNDEVGCPIGSLPFDFILHHSAFSKLFLALWEVG